MENAYYLFAAYTIIWVLLFGYVLVLINRQKRLRREIDELRELLRDKNPAR